MAGIWNVNSVYNTTTKRISSKLAFEIGQVFRAKIVSANALNNDLILKLLDGWQFSAKVEKPLDLIPKGLVKFVVEGFEDGKLQLKIVSDDIIKDEDSKTDSLEEALREQNITTEKDDYEVLKKMVKHEMPLTKENISKVKTILDFKNKMDSDTEQEAFVQKYIESKNLELDSPEGKNIKDILKGFFNQLKKATVDDLLTMYENGIDITKENLESFQKISKEPLTIYKDIQKVKEEFLKADTKLENSMSSILSKNTDKDFNLLHEIKQYLASKASESKEEFHEAVKEIVAQKDLLTSANLTNGEQKLVTGEKNKTLEEYIEYLKKRMEESDKSEQAARVQTPEKEESINTKNTEKAKETVIANNQTASKSEEKVQEKSLEKQQPNDLNVKSKEENEKIRSNEKEHLGEKEALQGKKKIDAAAKVLDKALEKMDTAELVKEQIHAKTEEMKEGIKEILDRKQELKPEVYNKLMGALESKLNDFKVFNSVSNQYYYMDIPMNIKNYEYQCKLIIKDDRKKGKAIDSSNIKLVANVKTMHMGTVDAFIKVRENIMDIEMKCEEKGIEFLQQGKDKITKVLNSMGYNTHIRVDKKQQEVDLTSCREFFEDTDLNNINVRV